MTYSFTITVSPDDIDDLNHVNNLVYLQWVLEAAHLHWNSGASPVLQEKYVWVVLSHYIKYHRPAYESDELVIETWVQNSTATYCERVTLIKMKQTGETLVTANTKWCPILVKTMKPTRIIPEIVNPFTSE
ncbi:acyl-CoA thioesterase [Membranicola marinus]|uniref:Acyl-CoA thioesterase n=1 Tax=Membranihabitans marinus TaxID=1227546 RepID=A0A953L825_9BACT|nr:acyl-CoA thioesterase [Membranihabitans marinus]MBY5957240.1 acyl-CoA thioesterase [Membranihabitans marinus]